MPAPPRPRPVTRQSGAQSLANASADATAQPSDSSGASGGRRRQGGGATGGRRQQGGATITHGNAEVVTAETNGNTDSGPQEEDGTSRAQIDGQQPEISTRTSSATVATGTNPVATAPPSSTSQGSDDLNAEIARLRAELQVFHNAQAASAAVTNGLIYRPEGSAGRNFVLRDAMGLQENYTVFKTLRQITRDLAASAGMSCETLWRRQPAAVVARIGALARQKHEHFKRYPQDWPIEEFLKIYFKNQRAYRNRLDRIARGIPPRPRVGGRRNGRYAPPANSTSTPTPANGAVPSPSPNQM